MADINFDTEATVVASFDGSDRTLAPRDERKNAPGRMFTIRGETYHVRGNVPPEVLSPADNLLPGVPLSIKLESLDALILGFLVAEDRAQWTAARDPDHPDPLTYDDLNAVGTWLVTSETGRPTDPPSGSSTGPGAAETSTTLTDASASPAEPE